MARQNKIWFRKDIRWWMVTIGGRKVRLVQGRDNKKLAEQKFHELKVMHSHNSESTDLRVADVIEAFLDWANVHRSAETNRNYIWYGEQFAERNGYLNATELRPIHLTQWVDEHKWGQTTRRNAQRSIYRMFSWADEQGYLTHPMRKLMAVLMSGAKGTHVFLNRRGKPWTRNAIRLRIHRLKEKLKLPADLCAYHARHAFGTSAVLNGVDALSVATLMGHSSLEMVSKVYVHLAGEHEHLQTAAERATRRPGVSTQQAFDPRRGD